MFSFNLSLSFSVVRGLLPLLVFLHFFVDFKMLSLYPSIRLSNPLIHNTPINQVIYQYVYQSIHPANNLSICLPIYQFIYQSIYHLSVYQFVYQTSLSINLSIKFLLYL